MDDFEISELFIARDKMAVAEVDKKYRGICRSIALSMLNSPEDAEECVNDVYMILKDEVCEGVLYSVSEGAGKRSFWRYPVTAAALLLVVGAAMFIINRGGIVQNNINDISITTENGQESPADTDSTVKNTEIGEETFPSVTEANPRIAVDKAVLIEQTNVLFTNQYPEITVPDLSGAQFTEMNTSELCEYYGLEKILSGITFGYTASSGETITRFTEITDENTAHGIYTFSDGSCFDINQFTFETEDFPDRPKRFTVTVGKKWLFGREYDPSPDFKVGQTVYYNEEKQSFFMVYEKYGSCIMISGKLDELSDFDDPIIKEIFNDTVQNDEEYWQGVPGELILFQRAVFECVGTFENITLEDWSNVDAKTCIIPDKLVFVDPTYILYTNKYPTIPEPDLSEAYFTEMSTSELCEYYGLLNIPYETERGDLIEETNENTSHGIYTLSNGGTYDINTFTFKVPYDTNMHGKKFTVTVGKNTSFGKEYNQEPILEVGKTVYYNEEDKTFFAVIEKYGSYIMISGMVDELSDFDNPTAKEAFYAEIKPYEHEDYWKGVPCELGLFIQNVAQCVKETKEE